MELLDRYLGTFLGLAIGDALGMPTESLSRQKIAERFGTVDSYRSGYLPRGSYTDDTHQTLILAESLLENKGLNLEKYRRDLLDKTVPKRGLGPSLHHFLFYGESSPYPSNGVAMKVSPVPLFYLSRPDQINSVVEQLAGITHSHPVSLAGAIALAQSIYYVLKTSPEEWRKDAFLNYVSQEVKKYDPLLAEQIVSGKTEDNESASVYFTVPPAIQTFADNPAGFKEGIVQLVNSGGDTDTKASMFGALSGAFNGYRLIPSEWKAGLEDKDKIVRLAREIYLKRLN